MERRIEETDGGSLVVGQLPEGCRLCIRGAKLVLLVTGICRAGCYYCPLSRKRMGIDVVFADEVFVRNDEDILKEGRMIDAEGAGITGGDPLLVPKRTMEYIELLKKGFGDDFHIHLYTSGSEATKELLRNLAEVGLDEIRFHPNKNDWEKIAWATDTSMVVGAEMPAIPGNTKDLKDLILYLDDTGADFLNLNELEFSETNAAALKKRDFKLKEDSIAAVEGSEEMALEILYWASPKTNLNLHYCPVSLKDGVQFRNRLIRKARNVVKPFEEITEEGLLVKGIIYSDKASLEDLQFIRKLLIRKYDVPSNMIEIDINGRSISTAWYIAEDAAKESKKRGFKVAIVEEYPTEDRFRTTLTPI
ncbi:MAG: radical SAM protein [Candidatus Hodarchaeota archaeon]